MCQFLFLLSLLLISGGRNDQSGFTLLGVSEYSLSESMSVGSDFPLEYFISEFSLFCLYASHVHDFQFHNYWEMPRL